MLIWTEKHGSEKVRRQSVVLKLMNCKMVHKSKLGGHKIVTFLDKRHHRTVKSNKERCGDNYETNTSEPSSVWKQWKHIANAVSKYTVGQRDGHSRTRLWCCSLDADSIAILINPFKHQQPIKGKFLLSTYSQLQYCMCGTVWRNWQVISCLD